MNYYVYQLTSENLSGLGGPMGTEYTTTNFTKLFSNVELAQQFAEKDYGKKIDWKKNRYAEYSSGDLIYVMYTIREKKIDEIYE